MKGGTHRKMKMRKTKARASDFREGYLDEDEQRLLRALNRYGPVMAVYGEKNERSR